MNENLRKKVITYLSKRRQKKKIILLICILSVIVSAAVYRGLMAPAISMTDGEIHLSASETEADAGENMTLHISAAAGTENAETCFAIVSSEAGVLPADESLRKGSAAIRAEDGSEIAVTLKTDDKDMPVYSFTLESGKSVEFSLDFTAKNSEAGKDISAVFGAAAGQDEKSAAETAAAGKENVSLVWKAPEETAENEAVTDDGEPASDADDSESAIEKESGKETQNTGAQPKENVKDVSPSDVPTEEQSAAASAAGTPDRASVRAGDPVDFTQYITSAEFKKIVDGQWQENGDTFEDGEMVQVTINYHLEDKTIDWLNREIYYVLPEGIVPTDAEMEGDVQSSINGSQTSVGTYTITTDADGKSVIAIKFNRSFAVQDGGFDGDIMFTAHTYNKGDADKTVTIGDKTITVKPAQGETDLSSAKSGEAVDEDHDGNADRIDYKITVSSSKGTGKDPISIHDEFSNDNSIKLEYDESTIKVVKKGADGKSTDVNTDTYELKVSDDENGKTYFDITGLPALGAGESYEVTYSTNKIQLPDSTDGEVSVYNSAYGQYGDNQYWTWSTVPVSKRMIQKTGDYNPVTKEITWTITINPEGRDMKGYTLKDEMTGADGSEIKLPDEVTLTKINSDGTTESKKIKLPYTFDKENDTATYEITYTTEAPDGEGGTTDNVSNKATLTPPDDEKPDFSTEVQIPVYHAEAALDKYFSQVVSTTENGEVLQWGSIITVPEGGTNDLVYTDTLLDGDGETNVGVHYTTPKQLAESLEAYENGTGKEIEYEITGYQKDGEWVPAGNVNAGDKVTGFKIQFPGEITCEQIRLTYNTTADYSSLSGEETQSVKNKGEALEKEDIDEHSKQKPLEKQVSKDGSASPTSYTGESATVDYKDGILYYRILIHTVDNEAITLTDTLPKGAKYVEGSVGGAFYFSDNAIYTEEGYYGESNGYQAYNFAGEQKPTASFNAESNTLTINIQPGYNAYYDNGVSAAITKGYKTLMITYQVSVAGDNWTDMQPHTYENTVKWEGHGEDTQETTVTRENDSVQKKGWQTSDDSQVIVEYQVEVNPAGSTLGNGDTVTLTDVLTAGQLNAELLLNTVKLYHYSESAEDHRGEEILNTNYKFTYDPATHTITALLPDRMHCILTYQYRMAKGNLADTNFTVDNKAVIKESGEEGADSSVNVKFQDSSASAGRASLSVYKVDAENYSVTLPEAEFELASWNENESKWDTVNERLRTDKNGRILFDEDCNGCNAEYKLKRNTLYKMTETKAPYGYEKSDKPLYFVWMDGSMSSDRITIPSEINKEDVHFVATDYGASLFVPNEYTAITVNKRWLDEDGKAMDVPAGSSIQVQLYQQKYKHSGVPLEVTLEYEGGFQKIVEQVYINPDTGGTFSVNVKTSYSNGEMEAAGFKKVSDDYPVEYSKNCNLEDDCNFSNGKYQLVINLGYYYAPLSNLTITGDSITDSYEPAGDATPYPNEAKSIVTLNAENDWTHTWSSIPKTDDDGNPYYYSVKEIESPAGFTSEVENNGIQTGVITVTNRSAGGVELPETGGIGKVPVYAAGTVLTAFAGSALVLQRKVKNRNRRRK